MPILDLYNHQEKKNNLAHFAALASLAAVDGDIVESEKKVIDSFARKLEITEAEYKEVMKKENKYPVQAPVELEMRLERVFDFFRIIFADYMIEDEEMAMVKRYAIGIGFTPEKADEIIAKSVAIFTGRIDFEDYMYLLNK